MSDIVQTPANENATAETHERGSEEAAIAALQKQANPDKPAAAEKPKPEPTSEAETEDDAPAADSSEEAPAADPDADTDPAAELVAVEYEGKSYEVPPELQKALLRQADYSRSMNAVKAQEATYKARLEAIDAIEKTAEKRAESLAAVRSIEAQMKGYEGIDWAKAKAERPAEAALAAVELMSLQQQRTAAMHAADTVGGEVQAERMKLLGEQRAEMDTALGKELKGWGDAMGTALTKYAIDSKVKLETLQALTDPAMVVALDKARRYDALQSGKPALREKLADAPQVLRPGAPRANTAKADAMARLRTEKTPAAAEAAFLARSMR